MIPRFPTNSPCPLETLSLALQETQIGALDDPVSVVQVRRFATRLDGWLLGTTKRDLVSERD